MAKSAHAKMLNSTVLAHLGQFQSFGDKALSQAWGERGTTVVTEERIGLFSITPAEFRETVKEYAAETLLETLLDCVHNVTESKNPDCFSVFGSDLLRNMVPHCLHQTFQAGEVLLMDHLDSVYILGTGKIQVCRFRDHLFANNMTVC
eukprot:CAMPEP_0198216010 /NCGR_PEP_ID=MMETSP1445-20131203/54194_1 /TAXON_ID=36898 /ORGANISM="Pyramimonas sp., Strain CCMP2087" /LENGTH=147 /DNA_ID=CAMNT_0043892023 /DNA_START=19 /DNA_END=462 /DNA_ORIENTATION=+